MNKKLKFIIVGSSITALFIGVGVFLVFKFVYVGSHDINPKKDMQTKVKSAKSNIEDGKEKKVNIEIKRENKNENKLKKFESKDDNNVNVGANTSDERKSNGSFYIDNINDLYNNKIVSLDEMFLIEKRLKEAVEDMPKLYKETLNIKNDDKTLNKYILKNKDRLDYLYGVDDISSLKILINKLSFIKSDVELKHGVISNITKQDYEHINFIIGIYSRDNKEQILNVTLEFKSDRAVLSIKMM
ncbi:hypothetical protein [Clostridium felsineum]|uniref:Uncharacterized protein n=1 Tax=Clostridium felsineum TaxID=36839 RepID=A0A1S8LD98_9CLOT|nr:hypothetical protein [Clostridium felsineum]URZ05891.1 hypothetical protein CLROS_012230 [Clostridium felsineum]URZ10928.1 hypothetical protein CROST_016440 [Clostridium felsineum]